MGLVADRFDELRRSGRKAFVPFLTAGYPDPDTFRALLRATRAADCVEIGLPFSDPVADGPSICASSESALAHGMHSDSLFELLRGEPDHPPAVLMTYLNPVLAYGPEAFFAAARAAGIAGILLTDLPGDEGPELRAAAGAAGLDCVTLVAPTTGGTRMAAIAAAATGFVYCVAVAGTTGARHAVHDGTRATVERVRAVTDRPVVVGFGISTPDHVREVCRYADGVVVGSALVDFIAARHGSPALARDFEHAIEEYAAAAHAG